jgi:hypothetical protein
MEKPDAVEATEKLDDYSFTTLQLGIWRMLIPIESAAGQLPLLRGFSRLRSKWNHLKPMLPTAWRFLWEVYGLNPGLNLLLYTLRLAASVQDTLMLYASSRLLRTVSH